MDLKYLRQLAGELGLGPMNEPNEWSIEAEVWAKLRIDMVSS